jgi:hypothetical protein
MSRKLSNLGELATELLAHSRKPSTAIGRLVGVADDGYPLVDVANCGTSVVARYVVPLTSTQLAEMARAHQEVLLAFEGDDTSRPIITGVLQTPKPSDGVVVDGTRIRMEGKDEIVLACGEASITLRRNGRVIIRGTHLESDSLGANWIRGIDIQLG